jgi:hypothetical protein
MKPLIGYLIGFAIPLLLIVGGFAYYNANQCREEDGWLYSQWLMPGNYTGGGDCSAGCLHMRFIPQFPDARLTNAEVEAFIGHVRTIENWAAIQEKYGRTFYFADENITRANLNADLRGYNSMITVRWCKTPVGERIRGVKMYEN